MTGSGVRPLDRPCSEQGKQPTAKAFKLAERDKKMSEEKEKSSFMQELDRWTAVNVADALYFAAQEGDPGGVGMRWSSASRRRIREKVLQSYRNGLGCRSQPADFSAEWGQPANDLGGKVFELGLHGPDRV